MILQPPLFSIVIPMYNRRQEIRRALSSVLTQEFTDFEVLVVDDGSTDGSAQAVEAISDIRLRLIKLDRNCGVCPARNAGTDAARGEWIIFLDSDDELAPGALTQLRQRILEAPPDIDRIAGVYRWDDGTLSPDPYPTGQVLDYAGYILWTGHLRKSDFHNTIRRRTFQTVRLPDSRAYETVYHLDFARHFKTWLLPDLVALAHQDAANRAGNLSHSEKTSRLLRDAPDGLLAQQRILAEHGEILARLSPARWQMHNRILVLFTFLAGRRREGLRSALVYFREFGAEFSVAAAVALGFLSPRLLAWVQATR